MTTTNTPTSHNRVDNDDGFCDEYTDACRGRGFGGDTHSLVWMCTLRTQNCTDERCTRIRTTTTTLLLRATLCCPPASLSVSMCVSRSVSACHTPQKKLRLNVRAQVSQRVGRDRGHEHSHTHTHTRRPMWGACLLFRYGCGRFSRLSEGARREKLLASKTAHKNMCLKWRPHELLHHTLTTHTHTRTLAHTLANAYILRLPYA